MSFQVLLVQREDPQYLHDNSDYICLFNMFKTGETPAHSFGFTLQLLCPYNTPKHF